MKRFGLALFLLFAVTLGLGQGFRYDNIALGTNVGGATQRIPNPTVVFCSATQTSVANCLLNPSTTFTDSTTLTPCSTLTQLTAAGTSTCSAIGDGQGNFGAWLAPGAYKYVITATGFPTSPLFDVSAHVGVVVSSNLPIVPNGLLIGPNSELISNAPRMTWSAEVVNVNANGTWGLTVFDRPIIITHISYSQNGTVLAGCSVQPTINVGSASFAVANGTGTADSGLLSSPLGAGLSSIGTTAGTGCTGGTGTNYMVTVAYKMQ